MAQVAIRSWGNSQGIRIPKDILEKLQLKVSDVLDIEIENDCIVLKKQFVHKTFEERLAEYNGEITGRERNIMNGFYQGEIIKITGFKKQLFVIVSKNSFIKATGIFHVW